LTKSNKPLTKGKENWPMRDETKTKRKLDRLDLDAMAEPWLRAAERAEREGKPVLAVFFRSEAARMKENACLPAGSARP
jgi:hypothetical protein